MGHHWSEKLPKDACSEALKWAHKQKTPALAWKNCQRGDWMLWLLGKLSGTPESASRKKLVLAACACARLALPHMMEGELRPLKAIETAEAWARGEDVTLKRVRDAAASAASAASAAYAAYAADAADAAAYAAYAADAADAATYAASAADAAAYAASAADAKTRAQCADIVRKHYPKAPAMRGNASRGR